MSTLSDLVHAHSDADETDIEWLHLLLADGQLIADLAFADIVLWVPTRAGAFVAVGHARPSSSATLFYRDVVGELEWKSLASFTTRLLAGLGKSTSRCVNDACTKHHYPGPPTISCLEQPRPSGKELRPASWVGPATQDRDEHQ